jgi:photosystem II stability/assembly factor-like uncharacterized protein
MPLDDLPFALPQMLVADPSAPNILYQATGDLGIFKSVDGGVTWRKASTGITGTNIRAMAIDPVHPQTLYAAMGDLFVGATSGIYKIVDGANHWTLIDTAPTQPYQLVVDAQNTNILYQVANTVRKTTDGGVTWNPVTFPGTVKTLVLDPHASGSIVAISNPVFCGFSCANNQPAYLYRSADGGVNWAKISSTLPPLGPLGFGLTVDGSTNPATVYDGLGFRSDDGGITWTTITPPSGVDPSSAVLAVDPSGTLYAAGPSGIFISRDHAQTWTLAGSFTHPIVVDAVQCSRGCRLLVDVDRIHRRRLHPIRQFVTVDAGRKLGVQRVLLEVLFVELVQQLQPRRLFFRCAVGGRLEVHNRRTTRPELRALVCRRHIAVAPIGRGRAATR